MRKVTSEELTKRQAWSWRQKVDHSLGVIDQFIAKMDGKVFVSFSGGKDSCVLLDLCRIVKPDIKAVFFNTGMEYPDIIRHIRQLKEQGYDIEFINAKQKPAEIWSQYGFPLVSKEQAQKLWYMKNVPETEIAKRGFGDDPMQRVSYCWRFLVNETFDCNSKCCNVLKKNSIA